MTEIQQLIKTHGEQGASKDCHDHQFDDTRNSMYLTYRRGHNSLAPLLECAVKTLEYYLPIIEETISAGALCRQTLEMIKKELAK